LGLGCLGGPSGGRSEKAATEKGRSPHGTGNGLVREADWPGIKELFPDAADLHDTYAEWLKDAEASVKRLPLPDATVEPVIIDIDDFLGWCMVHGNMSLGRSTVNIQAKEERVRSFRRFDLSNSHHLFTHTWVGFRKRGFPFPFFMITMTMPSHSVF
jgi:hypothetical protein